MDAIKNNYEKLLFLLAFLILAWSGYSVFSKMSSVKQPTINPAGKVGPLALDAARLNSKMKALTDRWEVPEEEAPWITSEPRFECDNCGKPTPYVEGAENIKCVFCGTAVNPDMPDRDNDSMPNEYEVEHGLDPNDPADAILDKDGDYFWNVGEYQGGTSPSDATDHPPYAPFLYTTNMVNQRVRMGLRSKSRIGENKYFFNLVLPSGKTQPAGKIGQTYEGFKLLAFEEKEELIEKLDNKGKKLTPKKVDVSELTVEKVANGRSFTLVLGKPTIINDVSAEVRSALDPEFKAPIDEWKNKTFAFKGERYELQKLMPNQAELKQLDREDALAIIGTYPQQTDPNQIEPQFGNPGFQGEGGFGPDGVPAEGYNNFPPGYFEPGGPGFRGRNPGGQGFAPGVNPNFNDPNYVPPAPIRRTPKTSPPRTFAPSPAQELEGDMREFNRLKRSGMKP